LGGFGFGGPDLVEGGAPGGGLAEAGALALGLAFVPGAGGAGGVGVGEGGLRLLVDRLGFEEFELFEGGVADDLEVGLEAELEDGVGEGAFGSGVGRGPVGGGWGEGASLVVEGVVLDGGARGVGLACGGGLAVDAGEVGAGGGEDAEEGAGVLVLDVAGGGEAEELCEASLDGV
jgi:hypothetical protein